MDQPFDLIHLFILILFFEIDDLDDLGKIKVEPNRINNEPKNSHHQSRYPSQITQKHTISIQLPLMNSHFIIKKEIHPGQHMYFAILVILVIFRPLFHHVEIRVMRIPFRLQSQIIDLLSVSFQIGQSISLVIYSVLCYQNVAVSVVVQV